MTHAGRLALMVAVLGGVVSGARAQPPDPSGHWVGTIHAPGTELNVQIDLARRESGTFDATFSIPEQQLEGYPLINVSVDGATVRFELKANLGGLFTGALAAGGGTVANLDQGNVEIPIGRISVDGLSLSLEVPVVGGSYSGSVNAASTEVTGTWTQGGVGAPVTFRREP